MTRNQHKAAIKHNLRRMGYNEMWTRMNGFTYRIIKAPTNPNRFVIKILEPYSQAYWTRTLDMDEVLKDIEDTFGSKDIRWVPGTTA